MSDAPDGPEELRGGKEGGDPALEGATETGRQGVGYSETGSEVDDGTSQLPAEKSGNASGGAT